MSVSTASENATPTRALDERDLVHEALAPTALQVHAPPRADALGDTPALLGHDVSKQVACVVAVARGEQRVQAREEARLVGRVDAGLEQGRESEATHVGAPGQAQHRAGSESAVHAPGGSVRRRADHGLEHALLVVADRSRADPLELGHQQHGLDDARRGRRCATSRAGMRPCESTTAKATRPRRWAA